jgi:hypothetical protein
MAYGFSVFWLPLSKALGIKEAIKCGPDIGFFQELFITTCDWKVSTLGLDVHLVFRCLAAQQPCGAVGLNVQVHAKPAWSAPCAGAAAC